MIDTKELKKIIFANDLSQAAVATRIGMTPKTFYSKMKKGVFGSDEIEDMIELLEIKNPSDIFFAKKRTCQVTKEV